MAARKNWTRHELLILLNVYHKLRFGQMHERQPTVITLAKKLERTAGSVAMKLGNLASLDPALKLRGIKGLSGASKLDEIMWQEFHGHLDETVPASEAALRELMKAGPDDTVEVPTKQGIHVIKAPPSGPTTAVKPQKIRLGHDYFQNAVVNNFAGRCGVTQLGIRGLLVASHILPWSTHESERLNVRNGLCLSRLHDAAFDRHLISFDDNLRLLLSKRLRSELPQRAVQENFAAYEGQTLELPTDSVLPDLAFMAEHRVKFMKM
ncbi:MAG: HNH endonuclease [Prosthecobacter sp.]|uniref:HNH endonuclease n=1 Tax=Prosthecobacter sp. TaxID=1965333 RepID=UPI003BAF590C